MSTAVIILAGGKGTRMKSDLPKVLHKVAGVEMVNHILNATSSLSPEKILVIVGHGAEQVEHTVKTHTPAARTVLQKQQLGTGHAVMQTKEELAGFNGDVLILCGDTPLMEPDLLNTLVTTHKDKGHAITFVTAFMDDPTGLGRVVRADGKVAAIVEEKDCTPEQKNIEEINTGIYIVKAKHLFDLLEKTDNNNASEEYYLTEIVALALKDNLHVGTVAYTGNPAALRGINTKVHLAEAEGIMQDRLRHTAMTNGMTLIDPASTFLSLDTTFGADCVIGPNVTFGPEVTLGDRVHIEGHCHIENTQTDDDVRILSFSHISGATLGAGASVGPQARLRPGANLGEDARVGSFCEVKKARIGKGSKVNHLTYVGDAHVGSNVNIGAGTIFANYNAKTGEKNLTTVGDGVAVGANTVLVAPVTLGDYAFIGAGTVVRKDVPPEALSVAKTEVVIKNGYTKPAKKGA